MNKKIMITWFIVIIMLLGTILLIGLSKKDLNYVKLEYNIQYKAYKYIKENDIKVKKEYTINIDKLIDENKIKKEQTDNYCIKGVKVEKKLLLKKYKVIVKCNEK